MNMIDEEDEVFATWTHSNGKPIVLTDEIYLANGVKSEGLKHTFY
jgi:hypothetical protein